MTEQIQQLTRERDETASKLAASRDENQRLNQNTVELAKLRAEVTRLRAIQHQVAQLKNSSDPFIQSVLGLTTRAAELNQHLEQMPDKRIPELQWLKENDWLNAAKEANFDTDANIRRALSGLPSRAKAHLYPTLQNALVAYIKANNEQLPDKWGLTPCRWAAPASGRPRLLMIIANSLFENARLAAGMPPEPAGKDVRVMRQRRHPCLRVHSFLVALPSSSSPPRSVF